MKLLIHWIAGVIARRLEAGSSTGAFYGALLGIMLGVGIGFVVSGRGAVDSPWTVAVPAAVVLGITGAIAGARRGPLPDRAATETAPTVRLNNLNRALVPVVAMIAFGAILGLGLFSKDDAKDDRRNRREEEVGEAAVEAFVEEHVGTRAFLIGLGGIATLISAVAAARQVWWVDVAAGSVVVRKPLSSRTYVGGDVVAWGFSPNGEGGVQSPYEGGDTAFIASFSDGRKIALPVGRDRAVRVASLLAGSRRLTPAPL